MYGKLLIQCEMKVLTGMHIGGNTTFSPIGAVDKPVIKDPRTNAPIVPGSSLKGKLRTLLARSLTQDIGQMPPHNSDNPILLRLFGASAPNIIHARLQFSDAFVTNRDQFREIGLTEVKTENGISSADARANPRQIERVSSGVVFGVRIVYDVMNQAELDEDFTYLARGLKLLQFDYLGGNGTRGYGRVLFNNIRITSLGHDITPKALLEKLPNLSKTLEKEVEACELLRM